jgi:flagellar biosynthesis/type III secretory pathway ATPase
LVEGDDMDDPVADATRSILDGHVALSRRIAERNRFPAVDVLASTSRVMRAVSTPEHMAWAGKVREWMATYAQAEDLINIGAYVKGASPKIDQAIHVHDRIEAFLRQGIEERGSHADTLAALQAIFRSGEAFLASTQAAQPAKHSV